MSAETLARRFVEVGARVRVQDGPQLGMPKIDIGMDGRGEYFDLRFPGRGEAVELAVIDVSRSDRHLLLLARDGGVKSKFLCGHDERHWFVAAVPETARGVTGVATAKVALQPDAVREAVQRARPKDALRRRNTAYVRQGEWFFVPAPQMDPPAALVLSNEPLVRGGGGKPHMVERVFRRGGEVVYVSPRFPQGITETAFARLPESDRRSSTWTRMVRDPEMYAQGTIRHPDHATIVLRDWHRVLVNTEHQAIAMRHVVFLD
jgi:hypothetical protein